MPSLFSLLVILGVLFLFSAFFSASEAALISINKVRLRHMMEKKKRGAHRVYGLISRMDKLIATILVGNNLVNTGLTAIATVILTNIWGEGTQGLVLTTLVISVVLIIFGDLVPKTMATGQPEVVAFLTRHLISFFILIFSPVTRLLTLVSNGFIRLLGGNPYHRSPIATEEEIKMMITIGKEEGFYGENEKKMLERIFHFDDTEVRDVMTPLEKMTAIPVDIDIEELERVLMEEGHNRIPVYQDTRANIIGVIYVRDLLYLFRNSSLIHLSDLMSAPFFVPPHLKVAELLKEFQRRKIQIAIVQDTQTKRATGLVTLEDLIEEIVGEIEEVEPPPLKGHP
jgi:Mg2+/Co2+ transporter CorB